MPTQREPSPPSQRSIVPLAPLEYLQTQRRGSITDPSLHAAKQSSNFRVASEPSAPSSSSASTPQDPRDEPRPSSAYVFGDATPHADSPGLRKILRSPSAEHDGIRGNTVDSPVAEKAEIPGADDGRRGSTSEDTVTGMKRKMSSDRNGEEKIKDGGGVVEMEVDDDGPAPKRRMSSIDTSRIAKLSLDDRRHSVDARWYTERRNSSTTYPAFPGPPAPPATANFAWSTTTMHPSPNHILMMPPVSYPQDRRMSVPDSLTSGPTRVLRSRSRPPSRQMRNSDAAAANTTQSPSPAAAPAAQDETANSPSPSASSSKPAKEPGSTPYSRSPELRVSHKLAERKRRKEMKELFDELRDQLPADRGMKASKWEILSKAIDFVSQLKHSHQEMVREIDMLKHEIDMLRQNNGLPPQFSGGPPPHALVYSQGPIAGPYPPLPPPGVMQHPPPPPHGAQQPPPQQPSQPPLSRPASSQNMFPPGPPPPAVPSPQQNGNISRSEVPPT